MGEGRRKGIKKRGGTGKKRECWRVTVEGEREHGRRKKGGKGLTKKWAREVQEK